MRVAVLQTNSQDDKTKNIEVALDLVAQAADAGADVAVLPECVDYLGSSVEALKVAEPIPGPTSEVFARSAREHGVWLLAGSIHEQGDKLGRSYNTSLLFDRQGEIVAKYRKIHLFDIEIEGSVSARESATISAGQEIVTADIEGRTAGLSICYDLRFPELYRALALQGAQIMFVPAAFTLFTGKDHWEVLLRARAIENQCFVVAAAQVGKHPPNEACYGRSMIVDPWGTVLVTAPDTVGMTMAELNFEQLRQTREQLPSLANRRTEDSMMPVGKEV